ncbi:JmjC domain-containing protein 7 [Thoreauomyces humboldtii]|nr:JmjC domain-containing protein 7 [Thoreauomyces humboldtii]
MVDKDDLEAELGRLARTARNLRGAHVPHLPAPPTATEFLRILHANTPVVIEHVGDDWAAFAKWRSRDYLEDRMGDCEVGITVTPNGLADAVVSDHFVLPHEQRISMRQLLSLFPSGYEPSTSEKSEWKSGAAGRPVYYAQSQNNNLSDEFAPLLADIPEHIDFASEAMGRRPDAVNIWIGSTGARTSVHKDHYENLYMVIAGVKTFVLIPPTEAFCLYEKPYTTARYIPSSPHISPSTTWTIEPTSPPSTTPWASVDPSNPDPSLHPLFTKHCRPITVTLRPGQMLYLPSLWHHQVLQEAEELDGCKAAIAVNWWYDMEYGDAFCQARTIARLGRLVAGIGEWDMEEDVEDSDAEQ